MRLLGDQNRIGMLYESGTYAVASGTLLQWIGLVQNHSVEDNRTVMPIRTEGAGTRDIVQNVYTTVDVNGTITYYPQDFRMLGYFCGSFVSTSGPNCTHTAVPINSNVANPFTSGTRNPFISFTIEDRKVGNTDFVRNINGATVNSLAISWTQGEPLTCDLNYKAKTITTASTSTNTITPVTYRPLLWKDIKLFLPSGTATGYDTTKGTITFNNSIEGRHVTNGSAEIDYAIPLGRNYAITVSMDTTSENTKTFYDTYYLGGSLFNMMVSIDASNATNGSRSTYLIFSGCNMTAFEQATPNAGINEDNMTIVPTTFSVNAFDRITTNGKWGAW